MQGKESEYPVRSARKERRIEEKTVLLLNCEGRYALRKRPAKGLLAGLWELPCAEGHLGEEAVMDLAEEQGLEPHSIESLGSAKHVFTHVEWHMKGYRIGCGRQNEEFVWASPEEIAAAYSIPTAFKAFKVTKEVNA